jgi:shikimate dehydrogenase
MRPTARTRLFALLGDPVRHSLSPRFQNAGFQAAGLDAVYVALPVAPTDLLPAMRILASSGGGGNITLPHKQLAGAVPAITTARVSTLGVANVFAGDGHGLQLHNTDVDGILAVVDALGVRGGAWQIIGTGGSARAVAGAALECGATIAVRSRDPERGAVFARWAESIGVRPAESDACQFVVNATPIGLLESDPMPSTPARSPVLRAALDLTYRTDGESRWVAACRSIGLQAMDGREVLLAQGAASWKLWFPGVVPPLEVMRAALDGRMG